MFHVGKCPNCQKIITYVTGEATEIHVGKTKYKGVTYSCPHAGCHVVLGVQIDPIALNQKLVSDLFSALRKG